SVHPTKVLCKFKYNIMNVLFTSSNPSHFVSNSTNRIPCSNDVPRYRSLCAFWKQYNRMWTHCDHEELRHLCHQTKDVSTLSSSICFQVVHSSVIFIVNYSIRRT